MSESEQRDEQFESFLTREAAQYNAPSGGVPRDEMWVAIQAARADAPAHARRPETRSPLRRVASRWPSFRIGAALAATLVLGVAIGRFVLTDDATTQSRVGLGRRDSTAAVITAAGGADGRSGANADSLGFGLAADRHMTRAEALLVSYGSGGNDRDADQRITLWARELLGDTRLMLDSPAAQDPARKRLLEDLEVVLVQIVQRGPRDANADERAHINNSIERTHVMARLRSARLSQTRGS
jgi:hypothetical protein